MIPNLTRETRRNKAITMPKNIEQLYKAGKCRECAVVVTRMNFAKILGKFNRVKIQYENNAKQKGKKSGPGSPVNSRLKSNENGMVLIHRNAYSEHPVRELARKSTPRVSAMKENRRTREASTNVLKENNRLKKKPTATSKEARIRSIKYYGVLFAKPNASKRNSYRNKFQLAQLLPIDKSLLPSAEWDVDYLPKTGELKGDKVYDRIAAELEDLMSTKSPPGEAKAAAQKDDFPSIMDILNDSSPGKSTTTNQSIVSPPKSDLQSSDVEAMLLGEPKDNKPAECMEVDTPDVRGPGDSMPALGPSDKLAAELATHDNPNSPSILDEALQKGSEEHIPATLPVKDTAAGRTDPVPSVSENEKEDSQNQVNNNSLDIGAVTHVVFRKVSDGKCHKVVTCPRNLKYSVELDGKGVEFLGAPKFVSSAEDLRVLLEIVNDACLDSLYVSHQN